MQKKISINSRIKSFKYALRGIWFVIKSQHNAWIHTLFAIAAIILGIILKINSYEWMIIIFSIAIVFAFESVNSAIEYLTDLLSPEYNSKAGKAKDIAAGAVLLSAMAALAAGLIIFLPKIF